MAVCNDRRWPEAWRVLGLQSVELVMLGYNTPSTNTAQTPIHNPPSKLLQPNALLNRPKEKRNPFAMFSHGTSAISRPGKAAQTLSGNGFSGGISQGFLNTGKSRRWSP